MKAWCANLLEQYKQWEKKQSWQEMSFLYVNARWLRLSSVSDTARYCAGKKLLKDERFMTQPWMMTMKSDSLLPETHAKGSLKHTCSI